ncbi:MAG: Gfo/Idh/MocA family oxidoreductase [Chloroflexi bacterium]|nr:Gfo/Idh/MocA family oxidoreductase [Chloroflexota bacterium]
MDQTDRTDRTDHAGRKARIGVIGAGWWAVSHHLPILAARHDVELVSVCRLGSAELEEVRRRFGFSVASEDFEEMLDAAPLDGVLVGSPHVAHHAHARAALKRGVHVMVEKPLATRTEDAQELVRLAHEQRRHILIPHGWNFRPAAREARRLVRQGAIGAIEHVVCHMASPLRDLFSGEPMQGTEDALFRPLASTWADPDRAGGYGWGQVCHALGLLFHIADLRPVGVCALMGRSRTGADLYDAAAVRFACGATGIVSGAGTVPKHCGFQLELRLFGSDGMLLFDLEEGRERLEVRRSDGRDHLFEMRPGDGAYRCVEPVECFVDLCLGRVAENDAPGEVGLRAVELLDAAYRSARSGGSEEVPAESVVDAGTSDGR